MSGASMSVVPKAARDRACQAASATDWRMPAAEPSTQSSRVRETISMIVRTPLPGSPSSQPTVESNSTSEEALDLLPSLSLRRWMRTVLSSPPGSTRGTTKQLGPSSSWAMTRKASDCGAEQNHLWPVMR